MTYLFPKQSVLLYKLHTCVHNNVFLDSTITSPKSSMSYIDFGKNVSQNSIYSRNCKSQRSLHEQIKFDKRELLVNWIHEVFNNDDKRKMWNKRLIKIAKKLKKPSGENILRKHIENILKNRDAFDARINTDYIINNIIALIKSVKVDTKTQFNVFNAKMACNPPKSEYLRTIIRDWIKKLPIKDVDSFGRPVDKDNIIRIMTNTLQLEINNINAYCISNLKNNILDTLADVPIDLKFNERSSVLKKSVNKLIKLILDAEDEMVCTKINDTIPCERNYDNNLDIRGFITMKIREMLDLYPLPLDQQNINYLNLKLVNMITSKLSSGKLQRNRLKEEIFYMLSDVYQLSRWKANKFTNIFITYLDNVFEGFIVDDNKTDWIDAILNACNSDSNMKKTKKKVNKSYNNNIDDVNFKKQLTDKISEWLEGFKSKTPELKNKNYVTTAAKDLSSSIVGRYKFLQHYPNRASNRREIEFLKYLIIIWLNKIMGRSSADMLKYVNVLLDKIVAFQNRLCVKTSRSEDLYRKRSTFSKTNLMKKNSEYLKNVGYGVPAEFDEKRTCERETIVSSNAKDLINTNESFAKTRSVSLITLADVCKTDQVSTPVPVFKEEFYQPHKEVTDCLWLSRNVVDFNVVVLPIKSCPSECKSIQCVYNHYSNILTSHCNELEINSIAGDKQEVIRKSILNNVWKTYYRLISDPQTDSINFKIQFDEQLEESLLNAKYIPILSSVLEYQLRWKQKLSDQVNKMFTNVQDIKSGIKFRQTFEDLIRKEFKISLQSRQELLLTKILDHYVMYSMYKEKNVFKAYIYRKRLVECIESLVAHDNIIGLSTDALRIEIFKIFENVGACILENEAKEVMFRDELEKWLKPFSYDLDTNNDNYLSCHKSVFLLAKNVNAISKIYSDETLIANEVEKEIESFLTTEIHNIKCSPRCVHTIKDFVKKWQKYNITNNDFKPERDQENEVINRKAVDYVHKVESRVRFEDLSSNCSNNVSMANKSKKTGILKDTKSRNEDFPQITDSSDERFLNSPGCRGCKVEIIGYKENVRLDGSDHSLTIINDLPPPKSTAVQTELPVCEGTNTEHLFLPEHMRIGYQNVMFPGRPIYVVDKCSQTSLDRFEGNSNVYCQKCKVLIENKKIRWSDDSEFSDYDDTESY